MKIINFKNGFDPEDEDDDEEGFIDEPLTEEELKEEGFYDPDHPNYMDY